MRHLLIWAVRMYRVVVPPQRRRSCLFRESCSQHVERIAAQHGDIAALSAAWRRFRACRPGYSFEVDAQTTVWELVCVDGSRFPGGLAADDVQAVGEAVCCTLARERKSLAR